MGLDIFLVNGDDIVAGNFRKTNCLVSWFEHNLASITNLKDCEMQNVTPYEITKEEIEYLLNDIDTVLSDHTVADEILPTCSGFFFGSTEYDELYYDKLNFVKDELKRILKEFDFENQVLSAYIWY